jgi:uncharacterized protein YyaL (SSP411 family)
VPEGEGRSVGVFDTADDAGALILRPRDLTDGEEPSGHSSIMHALHAGRLQIAVTGQPGRPGTNFLR